MGGPLHGIKVLDLTQALFGPYCTMLLKDLGAEVIKVERPPGGDMARGNGPFVRGMSTYFLSLNRGKKSLTLNMESQAGKELLLSLIRKVDILVENFKPGTMEKLGLSYAVLKQHNPRIIYVAGSGFGQYGPYAPKPAFDIIVQAMGGILSYTGEGPGRPPVRPGASYGDIAAAVFLCIGTLAALHERDVSGEGQFIDVSMLDSQVTVQENAFVRYLNTGTIPQPLGTRHPVVSPFAAFPTRDGYVALAPRGGANDQWPLFCSAINRLELIDDPRFQNGWLRTQHWDVLEPVINEALKTRTTAEWIKDFEGLRIPCGPVNRVDQVVDDPQIKAREMIVDLEHPKYGKFKVVNTPFKFSKTPTKAAGFAPELGEHTAEVLRDLLGLSADEVEAMKKKGTI
jgi:crotonobetainyl-CoA:carnitine CoA-transferase CaiB-like acyl-CoA transferase